MGRDKKKNDSDSDIDIQDIPDLDERPTTVKKKPHGTGTITP